MQVKIGCELIYQAVHPTPMVMLIQPRLETANQRLISETREVVPEVPVTTFVDGYGNNYWRLTVPSGSTRLYYDALFDVSPWPDPVLPALPGVLVQDMPNEVLQFLLPSRHCPSDLLLNEAWQLFGNIPAGWPRVQAVCDWLHQNITYNVSSNSSTSGYEAYRARQGVCRDFAHMGVMFCRALSIPARYVCGFLPDIGVPPNPTPMDFHAWFEAYVGGAWHTFDARHNIPRLGRVLIGRGRDAVDVALVTSYGDAQLVSIQVWADRGEEAQNTTESYPEAEVA